MCHIEHKDKIVKSSVSMYSQPSDERGERDL